MSDKYFGLACKLIFFAAAVFAGVLLGRCLGAEAEIVAPESATVGEWLILESGDSQGDSYSWAVSDGVKTQLSDSRQTLLIQATSECAVAVSLMVSDAAGSDHAVILLEIGGKPTPAPLPTTAAQVIIVEESSETPQNQRLMILGLSQWMDEQEINYKLRDQDATTPDGAPLPWLQPILDEIDADAAELPCIAFLSDVGDVSIEPFPATEDAARELIRGKIDQ